MAQNMRPQFHSFFSRNYLFYSCKTLSKIEKVNGNLIDNLPCSSLSISCKILANSQRKKNLMLTAHQRVRKIKCCTWNIQGLEPLPNEFEFPNRDQLVISDRQNVQFDANKADLTEYWIESLRLQVVGSPKSTEIQIGHQCCQSKPNNVQRANIFLEMHKKFSVCFFKYIIRPIYV